MIEKHKKNMEFEWQLQEQGEEFEKAHEHMTMQKQFLKQIIVSLQIL